MKQFANICIFLVLLAGCAQLGLAPADTFEKKLAYAYGQNKGFREAATQGVTQGGLSSAEGTAVLGFTDNTRVFLDAAKVATDPAKAQTNLTLALGVLSQIQVYLNARGIK